MLDINSSSSAREHHASELKRQQHITHSVYNSMDSQLDDMQVRATSEITARKCN
jgi:hypothetical protein